jgi:hypothetical protein
MASSALVCENDLRIGIDSLHDGGIDAIVEGYLLFGEHFGTAFAGDEGAVRGFQSSVSRLQRAGRERLAGMFCPAFSRVAALSVA